MVPNSESNTGATADKALDGSGLDPTGLMHDNSGYMEGRIWLGEVTNEPHGDGTGLPNPGTYWHPSEPGWFRVDFDRVYELMFARTWNGNGGHGTGRGMNQVVVEYSTTGGEDPSNWTRLGGPDAVHSFLQAPGDNNYTGFDLDFGGVDAKAVIFTALTSDRGTANFGGSGNIALSEVRFYIGGVACSPGDADADGDVNDDDLSWLLAHWGSEDATCAQGEFSGEPPVNDDDLSILLAHWTGPVRPDSIGVPEPAIIGLIALGGLTLLRRKR